MSVWEDRDLPVLRALATTDDENLRHGYLDVGHGRGAETLGLELDDVEIHDAVFALGDAGYVQAEVGYESGPGAFFTHLQVTGRGQQALGEWPRFEAIMTPTTLAVLLEHLARQATGEEERASLERSAEYVRSQSVQAIRTAFVTAGVVMARRALGLT